MLYVDSECPDSQSDQNLCFLLREGLDTVQCIDRDLIKLCRLIWAYSFYSIYPKYSDNSTPYHICSKI